MRKFLKSIVTLLLLLNGISALIGGLSLIFHPDGSTLGLSVSLLANSPFVDYRLPGIELFSLIGILSLLTVGFIHIGRKKSSWFR